MLGLVVAVNVLSTSSANARMIDSNQFKKGMILMGICNNGRLSIFDKSKGEKEGNQQGRCSDNGGIKVKCNVTPVPQECQDIINAANASTDTGTETTTTTAYTQKPKLPHTGGNVIVISSVAVGLLAAGFGFRYFMKRRKANS